MSGPPATYSFGADAVRYGSDLSGQNSAYFLQQSSGTAVVPSDLLVKGDLQVDGTSALKGAVTVGTPSVAVATTLNGTLAVSGASNFTGGAQVGSGLTVGGGLSVVTGNLAVSAAGASISAPNFQGTNSVDGFRASFAQGLISNNVSISGSGGSTLLLGDATTPGGNVIGYNGSSATLPVNFPFGLVAQTMAATSQGDVVVLNSTADSPYTWAGSQFTAVYTNGNGSGAQGPTLNITMPSDFLTNAKWYGRRIGTILCSTAGFGLTIRFVFGGAVGTKSHVYNGPIGIPITVTIDAVGPSVTNAGLTLSPYGIILSGYNAPQDFPV